MIRTKGEAGTGDIVHAVKHLRNIFSEIRTLTLLDKQELHAQAKNLRAPYELVFQVAQTGKLPVPNFSAGGIATPADAALTRQLGGEAVFVGSGIFMKDSMTFCTTAEAESRAQAIVMATTHFQDSSVLLEASSNVIGSMKGLAALGIPETALLQKRGW
jgi:pyridoxal 5'-phosphate synthase pdxS subunit